MASVSWQQNRSKNSSGIKFSKNYIKCILFLYENINVWVQLFLNNSSITDYLNDEWFPILFMVTR